MFYSKQLEHLIKAEVHAQMAHELMALIGGNNLPEQVEDKLRAESNRHHREREKWEKKLAKSFTTT